jgi:hypothetical protein
MNIMNVKNYDLHRNDKPDVEKDSIWIKTDLHEFGLNASWPNIIYVII